MGIVAVLALATGCAGGDIPVLEEAGRAAEPPAPAGCGDIDQGVLEALASGANSLSVLTTPQGIDALRDDVFEFDHRAYRDALAITQFVAVTGIQDEEAGAAIAALDDAAQRAGRIVDQGTPSHADLVAFVEATGGPGALAEHHQVLGAALARACGSSLP